MIHISFCGDLRLLSTANLRVSSDITNILNRCEYNVINFEAPITTDKMSPIHKSGPNLFQDIEASEWVEEQGWNVVSLANNHVMDYGNEGILFTINSFKKVNVIGVGNWEQAYSSHIFDSSDGGKIGIIACAHREFGCLYDEYSQQDKLGYAWVCHPKIDEMIIEMKKEVDFLFVYAHAGVEHLEQPLPEWRSLYRHFIEMGCDGVIASHPHIPMGHEVYKGKPIFFSLGNFCFQIDQYDNMDVHWLDSILVEVICDKNGTIEYKEYPIVYRPKENLIQINQSEDIICHINQLNHCLLNDDQYLQFVNRKVSSFLPWYMKLFSYSGLIPIQDIEELSIKTRIKNKIMGRKFTRPDYTSKAHLLNNLQCESHRWAIERGLKLKYNI